MKERVSHNLSITAGTTPCLMKDVIQFISKYWFLIVIGVLFAVLMGMAVFA